MSSVHTSVNSAKYTELEMWLRALFSYPLVLSSIILGFFTLKFLILCLGLVSPFLMEVSYMPGKRDGCFQNKPQGQWPTEHTLCTTPLPLVLRPKGEWWLRGWKPLWVLKQMRCLWKPPPLSCFIFESWHELTEPRRWVSTIQDPFFFFSLSFSFFPWLLVCYVNSDNPDSRDSFF